MAKKTTKKITATYNQEFRETAIKLALGGDKPISEVAKELEMPPRKLYAWVSDWKKKNNKDNSSAATELHKLQKRNKELELENEILKKAAAYFAKTLL
jgi:transposase